MCYQHRKLAKVPLHSPSQILCDQHKNLAYAIMWLIAWVSWLGRPPCAITFPWEFICDQHTKLARMHSPRSLRAQNVRPTQKTCGYSSAITISASVRPTQKTGMWYLGFGWKNRPTCEIRPHERLSCVLHMNPVCATDGKIWWLSFLRRQNLCDLVAKRTRSRSAFTQRLRDVSSRFRHTLSRIHSARGACHNTLLRWSHLYAISNYTCSAELHGL